MVLTRLGDWHVYCWHCTYGRFFGADEQAARLAMRKHGHIHNTHRVLLYDPQGQLIERHVVQDTLPFEEPGKGNMSGDPSQLAIPFE